MRAALASASFRSSSSNGLAAPKLVADAASEGEPAAPKLRSERRRACRAEARRRSSERRRAIEVDFARRRWFTIADGSLRCRLGPARAGDRTGDDHGQVAKLWRIPLDAVIRPRDRCGVCSFRDDGDDRRTWCEIADGLQERVPAFAVDLGFDDQRGDIISVVGNPFRGAVDTGRP